ncbi:hypothetical protein ACHHYP_15750 [Achlya hypogyna]|uniref:PH domain-containing protein n=1 Tax=Achlya hypogyna TaxID=1202772 RepID=A0A1V9YA90_ACHHY|nr:hypothetical protein ACHHYP_15750 [Achlya hypogyna]
MPTVSAPSPRRGTETASKASPSSRFASAPQMGHNLLMDVRPASPLAAPPSGSAGGVAKAGYLTKHNAGKWKRRRWHQRWFVLEKGVLSYYKYASSKAIDRSDAHGELQLHGTGALLVIQGDLPRGTPTPFCFSISVGSKTLMVCADTDVDFREWTDAISATINQDGPAQTDSCKGDALLPLATGIEPATTGPSTAWDAFFPPTFSLGTLAVANPLIAVIRYGTPQAVAGVLVLINLFCLWLCFTKAARPDTLKSKAPSLPPSEGVPSKPPADTPETRPPILGQINGDKAKAGCSLRRCEAAEDEATAHDCWAQLDATRFKVRQGPNYRKTKLKGPSALALLDLVATDVYRSDSKVDNIGSIVQLPQAPTASRARRDLVIINCQVPCYAPSNPLWGEKQGDGDGFNFVTYYAISESLRTKLDESPPCTEPAVRLLRAFLSDDSGAIVRDRLKAIGVVVNPSEQALGRTERHLLETYNGQPILTRPQHRFYRGDGYFEIDIDAHLFNFVARKGLCGVTEHFGNMVVDFGFVLEGQEDDELPEQILGCVRLCKVDVKTAPHMS